MSAPQGFSGRAPGAHALVRWLGLSAGMGSAGGGAVTLAALDTRFSGATSGDNVKILDPVSVISSGAGTGTPSHADLMLKIMLAILNAAGAGGMVKIAPIEVCASACDAASVRRGIMAARGIKAQIVLMSLAGLPGAMTSLEYEDDVISSAVGDGMTLFGAMGNTGRYAHSLPACVAGVIPVAACGMDGRRMAYSGYCADVRRRGLLAPGSINVGRGGAGGQVIEGTSVAAAVAAAVAAVIMASDREMRGARLRHAMWKSGFTGGAQTALNARRIFSA